MPVDMWFGVQTFSSKTRLQKNDWPPCAHYGTYKVKQTMIIDSISSKILTSEISEICEHEHTQFISTHKFTHGYRGDDEHLKGRNFRSSHNWL